ncbi:hypothetical protein [Piscinibacter koreensis]|nr:hypothetical protein [Schlegelella koreensis]
MGASVERRPIDLASVERRHDDVASVGGARRAHVTTSLHAHA